MTTFTLNIQGQHHTLPKPCLMGIINRSPNSFFNPSQDLDSALHQVEAMVLSGAALIDVGGEATNPNVKLTQGPSLQAEIDRVATTVEAIRQRFNVLISVDTSQPQVMQAAVGAGAHMINDQRALTLPGALTMAAHLEVPVCLMHFPLRREPGKQPLAQFCQIVVDDLLKRVACANQAGIPNNRLILDPGFGQGHYGKNCEENFYLLKQLKKFTALNLPVLTGWSRKSMIGEVLGGAPPEKRLYGSIAAATIAVLNGASILRVHDVAATHDALRLTTYYQHTPA